MKYKKALAFLTVLTLCSGVSSSVFATKDLNIPANTYAEESVSVSDGVSVTTYEELSSAITAGEEKIYILNSIEMKDQIQLSGSNQSLIGVPSKDGALPVLNFENMKGENDVVNGKSSDRDVAVRISGSQNEIKNLIIEKGHDNGILIKGTKAINNKVTNCILRYNNDSGLQITGGSRGNIIKGVYSYRNCDVFTLGGNADGFAIKLGAGPSRTSNLFEILDGRNVFKDCYAWENSDDAWDSFDKELKDLSEEFQAVGGYWTYRNDYENCMCWNNGTAKNVIGYTDYINGVSIDENLPFIRRLKAISSEEVYNNFVKAYNDKTICSVSASFENYCTELDNIFVSIKIPTSKGEFTITEFVSNWGGNPNGFKFGSKFTQPNSLRYLKNCIAFDHEKYGFDKNNSGASLFAENCVSFKNKINYHLLDYTAYKWDNIKGFDGAEADDLPKAGASNIDVSVGDGSEYENEIRSAAKAISENAFSDKTSDNTNLFDVVF